MGKGQLIATLCYCFFSFRTSNERKYREKPNVCTCEGIEFSTCTQVYKYVHLYVQIHAHVLSVYQESEETIEDMHVSIDMN